MKLRNKLIPLASGLVTVATVAPVSLTACSSAGWTDLKDGFTPSFSRLAVEGNKLDTDTGAQVYFNAVSENPDIFAQDYNWTMSLALRAVSDMADNSQLDTAKQSVTNVKVGKTTVGLKQYYTLSFTYTREQQFTWNHLSEESGMGESQVKTVGQTLYSMEVKNIPMTFYSYWLFNESNNSLGSSSQEAANYTWYLGRGLFGDSWIGSQIRSYLRAHSEWHLSPQPIALMGMKDPWSIKYTYKANDTNYTTYNDITSAHSKASSYEGFFDNSTVENWSTLSDETKSVIKELLLFTCASFYMSDITNTDLK